MNIVINVLYFINVLYSSYNAVLNVYLFIVSGEYLRGSNLYSHKKKNVYRNL